MLTKPNARALWRTLCAARADWLQSRQGRRLMKHSVKMVAQKDGKEEARIFYNLLSLLVCGAKVFG